MYIVFFVFSIIFSLLAFCALILSVLVFRCEDSKVWAVFGICLLLAIGTGIPVEVMNAKNDVIIPDEAVYVVDNVYDYNGVFVRKTPDSDQSTGNKLHKGFKYELSEVASEEVLDLLMDTPAPSVKQMQYMEDIAKELKVELPNAVTTNPA